jgi:hypothetical protein
MRTSSLIHQRSLPPISGPIGAEEVVVPNDLSSGVDIAVKNDCRRDVDPGFNARNGVFALVGNDVLCVACDVVAAH